MQVGPASLSQSRRGHAWLPGPAGCADAVREKNNQLTATERKKAKKRGLHTASTQVRSSPA